MYVYSSRKSLLSNNNLTLAKNMTTVHPPRGFTVIEDDLCRACLPLRKENAYFLEQNKFRLL